VTGNSISYSLPEKLTTLAQLQTPEIIRKVWLWVDQDISEMFSKERERTLHSASKSTQALLEVILLMINNDVIVLLPQHFRNLNEKTS
jgi:hypothetical protein